MKRAKRTIVILGLALASCRGPIYTPTATPQTFSVRILATTTTYPLLQDLVAAYKRPDRLLAVHSAAAGWETVYQQLRDGEVAFALTTYVPAGAALWVAPIGQDGIAVIVHPANTIPALTLDDLRLVFQGRITTWAEVGGADLPVTVVSREAGDDLRLVFQSSVMGNQRITLGARLALSDQSMIEQVAALPGAVGYLSMGQVTSQVRSVPIAAQPGGQPVLPTPGTVRSNRYPLRAPVLLVGLNPPPPGGVYYDWFAWMQGEEGQNIVARRYAALSH